MQFSVLLLAALSIVVSSQVPPQPAAVAPVASYPPLAELHATALNASPQVVKEEPLPPPPAPAALQAVPSDDDVASPKPRTRGRRGPSFFDYFFTYVGLLGVMMCYVVTLWLMAAVFKEDFGPRGCFNFWGRRAARRSFTPRPRQPQRWRTLRAQRLAHAAQAAADA